MAPEATRMKLKLMSINLRGAQEGNRFAALIRNADKWRAKEGVTVICAQEHNLDPAREDELQRIAASRGFRAVFGFAPAQGQNGVHWGGTLILCDERSVSVSHVHVETEDLTRVSIEWNGRKWDIASVYVPVSPAKRLTFIATLTTKLTKQTIVGGDWNCVPDVTLDASGPNALNYRNIGATALDTALAQLELLDIRREQLGNEIEITRIGDNIATRLDRWYVPLHKDFEDLLYTIETRSDLLFKKEGLDHKTVSLTVETPDGEAGHQRHTIREDLMMESWHQDEVARLTEEAYNKGGRQSVRWDRAHAAIRDFLLKETAKRRAKENKEIPMAKLRLKALDNAITRKGPSTLLTNARADAQKHLFKLENPESTPLHEERQAKNCADRSDKSTRLFFSSYKALAKQQWINHMKKADWKEGIEPNFEGATKTPKEVSAELMKFYKMLFAEKKTIPTERRRILQHMKKNKILAASRDALEAEITVEEIVEVMENLPLGKQPGPDRIPNAVYKNLSSVFAPKLAALIKEAIQHGELPKTFLQGDIGLIYRRMKEMTHVTTDP